MAVLSVDREEALAFRQRATHLHRRLPSGRLTEPAFAGLQDSAPRSAVLALHARVREVSPSAWKDSRFAQVWGPRGAVYAVPCEDVAVFTQGLLPRDPTLRGAVEAAAGRVQEAFRIRERQGERVSDRVSGLRLGDLRFASMTGTVRIQWDGSKTTWWIVDPPAGDAESARLELARRFLRSLGPSSPRQFAWWSGVLPSDARETFRSLDNELAEVELAGRRSWILNADRSALERATPAATVRLLPPGDPYLAAGNRELLLPERAQRSELWPKSVWPGALLVDGELAGTWRRHQGRVTLRPWRTVRAEIKRAVLDEVRTMPIESANKEVRWIRR